MRFLINPKNLLIFISLILFSIPFFWLKLGEIDLGGDASRLYFYDPMSYLKNLVIYNISPQGIGIELSYQFSLPFIVLLIFLKKLIGSSYLLITLFNSTSLVIAFLAMYGILVELLGMGKHRPDKHELISLVAIFASLFYLFIPISTHGGWDKALFDHAQIFINPLMFWLLLRFIHTLKVQYLLVSLLISFIFSPNFSYSSAPKFFAFFPIALIYLGVYAYLIKKIKLPLKVLLSALFLFVILHLFHLIQQISNLTEPSSNAYFKIFTSESRKDAINVFIGALSYITVSSHLLGIPGIYKGQKSLSTLLFVFPAISVIGLYIAVKKKNTDNILGIFLLTWIAFFISFFFFTAKITTMGESFYRFLFLLPGFSMFRNFEGQWLHSYLFFYTLLIAFSLFYVCKWISKVKRNTLFVFLIAVLLFNSWPFIKGDMINAILPGTIDINIPIVMNPNYEEVLKYIKNDPVDAKYLTFPLVDHFYQVLGGDHGGAYMGPSTIAYLTGKNDFGSTLILAPFTGELLKSAKEKNFKTFNNIFPILGIRYLFYNSDPYIYENFPAFPYQEAREYMPPDQKSYKQFVNSLSVSKEVDFGDKFHLYTVNEGRYLPHIYVSKHIVAYDSKESDVGYILRNFHAENAKDLRKAFIDKKDVKDISTQKIPIIVFQKLNPTKYEIKIEGAIDPYLLVFSQAFNVDWKLFLSSNVNINEPQIASYFNGDIKEVRHKNIFLNAQTFETLGKKPIAEDRHIITNGYANSWYITPKDVGRKKDYVLILEMTSQRLFYISLLISLLGVGICLWWLGVVLLKTNKK